MYDIRRMIVWAWRCRHSRGFGVQSPWAYSFIRYVVNEHYPYYAYKQLESKVKAVSGPERRLCQLYFRMANYLQPRSVVDFGSPFEPFRAYVSAGCRRAEVSRGPTRGGASAAFSCPATIDMAVSRQRPVVPTSTVGLWPMPVRPRCLLSRASTAAVMGAGCGPRYSVTAARQ